MKKCNKCNREFSDDKMFCPECGNQLTALKPKVNIDGGAGLGNWAGAILTVVGLIVMWEISWIYGGALVVVGLIAGTGSTNVANKIISWVCTAIAVLMLIAYL